MLSNGVKTAILKYRSLFLSDMMHVTDNMWITAHRALNIIWGTFSVTLILLALYFTNDKAIVTMILLGLFSVTYYFLRHLISRHFSLHRAILVAIKHHQFYPVYQPIYNVKLGQCRGAEVLLRWQVGNESPILPEYFIHNVEESGLIVPITLQLISMAFSQAHQLMQANRSFYLSFNISSAHFADPDFFDSFYALCKRYVIPSSQIMFEITERELLRHDDYTLMQRMHQLRELGYSLAIDDFGTGHANISYLHHFPFSHLKIDQLFIHAIGTGAITEILNQTLIELAKKLNLRLIAEGVETLLQVEYLAEHGIEIMQGWYFSKALSIEQLKDYVLRMSPKETY